MRLDRKFFNRPTLTVARELLGQRLVRTEMDGRLCSGLIVETEAYVGAQDLGCHAKVGRTRRNETLWGPPGHAYVYFTYGMHWLLNFVTEAEGFPAAVLIRGLIPEQGEDRMRERRSGRPGTELTNGPAKICQALAVASDFDGYDICVPEARLYVEYRAPVEGRLVKTGPRIGLNSVPEPWKSVPWRFWFDPRHVPR